MRESITFSERYRSAIWIALVFTVIVEIIGGVIIDMAEPSHLLASTAVFWGTVVMIMCRRPQNPTSLDLAFIRWACLPLIVGFQIAVRLVWHWRGLM